MTTRFLLRGAGHLVNKDKDIVYTHKCASEMLGFSAAAPGLPAPPARQISRRWEGCLVFDAASKRAFGTVLIFSRVDLHLPFANLRTLNPEQLVSFLQAVTHQPGRQWCGTHKRRQWPLSGELLSACHRNGVAARGNGGGDSSQRSWHALLPTLGWRCSARLMCPAHRSQKSWVRAKRWQPGAANCRRVVDAGEAKQLGRCLPHQSSVVGAA